MEAPAHVSVRTIAGESVLLNLHSGQYHGLDDTGTAFWRALEDGTFDEAVDVLKAQFGQGSMRIAEDLEAFCLALEQRGLVDIESGDR